MGVRGQFKSSRAGWHARMSYVKGLYVGIRVSYNRLTKGVNRMRFTVIACVLTCMATNASAESCVASQYGIGDGLQGSKTCCSKERFNTYALTAAHKTLPMGTRVRVTNLKNGKSVIVRINDRGPYVYRRCIDLSHVAANAIDMGGLAQVTVERE